MKKLARAFHEAFQQHPHALIICVGLGAIGIWMNLVGYSPIFVPSTLTSSELEAFGITRYMFYGGIISSCLLFSILGTRLNRVFEGGSPALGLLIGGAMCLSTLLFSFSYSQHTISPLLLASISCLVSGICYTLFTFIFYVRLALSENTKFCIASIAASLVVEMILADVFSATLSKLGHIIVGASMPILAGLLVATLCSRLPSKDLKNEKLKGRERTYHITLIFVVSFGSIAVMAARQVGLTAGLWGTRRDWLPPLAFNIVALIIITAIFLTLAWLTLYKRMDDRISTRYQLPFVVIIAGCILLLLNELALPNSTYSAETILINAIELFAHLFSWSIVISFIKTVDAPVYRVLGLRGLFFNALAIIWMTFFDDNNRLISAFILLIVFIIVIGIAAVPVSLNRVVRTWEDDALKRIAEHYSLSPREQEIFILLAQGRSRPYIQEKLFLADGTVKTHSTHIYSKLKVHSRQEMLDLIEEERSKF